MARASEALRPTANGNFVRERQRTVARSREAAGKIVGRRGRRGDGGARPKPSCNGSKAPRDMERLTQASPNGALIAIGNVMSGGLQRSSASSRAAVTRGTADGFGDAL